MNDPSKEMNINLKKKVRRHRSNLKKYRKLIFKTSTLLHFKVVCFSFMKKKNLQRYINPENDI